MVVEYLDLGRILNLFVIRNPDLYHSVRLNFLAVVSEGNIINFRSLSQSKIVDFLIEFGVTACNLNIYYDILAAKSVVIVSNLNI